MYAHILYLCLATSLHGHPSVVCNEVPLPNTLPTAAACTATLPSAIARWWTDSAPLLKITPDEFLAAGCEIAPSQSDGDGD